jgi:hypothetical protein
MKYWPQILVSIPTAVVWMFIALGRDWFALQGAWSLPLFSVLSSAISIALAFFFPRSLAWKVAALFNSSFLVLVMMVGLLLSLAGLVC